ncbi:MAG: hypothetical protein OEN23_14280 [Paracoccaceae bacterium]|nr:hypothetical protein [Paracoccaceae bacterium]
MRSVATYLAFSFVGALMACSQAGDANAPDTAPVDPVPTVIDLGVFGATGPVIGEDGTGELLLKRSGQSEPVSVQFQNGARSEFALAPGDYRITQIGELRCQGLDFSVDPQTDLRALGTVRAEIVKAKYYVALMAGHPAKLDEIAGLAEVRAIPADQVDARPISVTHHAPCSVHSQGPGQSWRDRPLGERIALGAAIAGFCAIALAAGGFCAF